MDTLSPDFSQLLRLVFALTIVISLMGGFSLLIKKFGLGNIRTARKTDKKRLFLIESLPLDVRRRAVILQCDTKQYFLILGPNGETLVDTVTSPVDSSRKPETPSS